MTLYAVTREAGPAWADGKSAFEQPDVEAHVGFMNGLEQQGTLLFAGPLAGTEQGRIRVLLIADASTEDEIRPALAQDPWEQSGRIVTTVIEPWVILVGATRLSAGSPIPS